MKRIVILGGGESGVGAAILAKKQGFDVFLSDLAEIKPEYKTQLEQNAILLQLGFVVGLNLRQIRQKNIETMLFG